MFKRGQLSLWIVVSVCLLLTLGILLMSGRQVSRQPVIDSQASIAEAGLSVRKLIESCLSAKLMESEKFGLSESAFQKQSAFVEAGVSGCADFSSFRSQGFSVSAGSPKVSIFLSDGVFGASMKFPVSIGSGGSSVVVDDFSSQIKLSAAGKIEQTVMGAGKEVVLVSGDRKAELRLLQGALASMNGVSIGDFGIRSVDRRAGGLNNGLVLGGVVFEGSPAGAEFYPWIELSLYYDALPDGILPSDLSIGYLDESSGLWVALPSRVDASLGKVTADVRHFSRFAIITSCSKGDAAQVLNLGWLYKEPCYESDGGVVSGTTPFNCRRWFIKKGPVTLSPMDVEQDNAPHDSYDGPVYAASQSVFRSGDENALPQFGTPKSGCKKADWDNDASTPDSYGYPSVGDVGGEGAFEFSIMGNGDGCVSYDKPVVLELVCDDSCSVEVNGLPVKGVQDPDVLKRLFIFYIPTSYLKGGSNHVRVAVDNYYQPCSSARGSLIIKGDAALEDCPASESRDDFLFRNCRCGKKNVIVAYKDGELSSVGFQGILSKKYLSDDEVYRVRDAVVPEAAQYCQKGKVVSASEFGIMQKDEDAYRSAFAALARSAGHDDVASCCSSGSRVYPDLSNERPGCEVLVCSRDGRSILAYTGKRLDAVTRQVSGSCSKVVSGDIPGFLSRSCGIKAQSVESRRLLQGFSESGGQHPCEGNGGSYGFMSCPLYESPRSIITGSYGSGNPNGEHCNPRTRYPIACDPNIVHWSRAIDVAGPGGRDSYDVVLPTVDGNPLVWEYQLQTGSNNGAWGYVKVFTAEDGSDSYLLRLTHMKYDTPGFVSGDQAASGMKVGELWPGLDGPGIGHVHVSVEKNGLIVPNPEHDLGLCSEARNPPACV